MGLVMDDYIRGILGVFTETCRLLRFAVDKFPTERGSVGGLAWTCNGRQKCRIDIVETRMVLILLAVHFIELPSVCD
jgi:hypothetical protein